MGIPFQCNKATRKLSKPFKKVLWQSLVVQFLVAFLHSCSQGLQQQPDEVPEQQDRQFLDASQMSTFLLSYRPSFITKSCDFLTCTVSMDGEEGVGGSRVKWGRLSTCKKVVDGYLCRARDL